MVLISFAVVVISTVVVAEVKADVVAISTEVVAEVKADTVVYLVALWTYAVVGSFKLIKTKRQRIKMNFQIIHVAS